MKDFKVRFGTGVEVLNAYWGFLSDGGLVIEDRSELAVGDQVSLDVHIESRRTNYALAGKVVRRETTSGQAVIAFNPGQPHDLLLSEALAETDNVPARKHRRYRINVPARLRRDAQKNGALATLTNISRGGCCARLEAPDSGSYAVGSTVEIAAGGFAATGKVVWQRGVERGIHFSPEHRDGNVSALLHEYLSSREKRETG